MARPMTPVGVGDSQERQMDRGLGQQREDAGGIAIDEATGS